MRLVIAEKPDLAKAIAAALPQPAVKRGAYYECADGTVVAYCVGHIYELADAEVYSPTLKEWTLATLPIIPDKFRLVPSKPELVKTLRGLLKRADLVIHAGDIDREGQLVVDEVIEELQFRGPVQRIRTNDLTVEALQATLAAPTPNSERSRIRDAARARQQADWLFGINASRLYTILARLGGYTGVLPVGRVQTPVLALVARRDLEIENFQPKPFFAIDAQVSHGQCAVPSSFNVRWTPTPESEQHLDDEGRLVSQAFATSITALQGKGGTVVSSSKAQKSEAPPLPYNLSGLQVACAKYFNFALQKTLDVVQSLYEKKVTSYPRTPSQHLPTTLLPFAAATLSAIVSHDAQLKALACGRARVEVVQPEHVQLHDQLPGRRPDRPARAARE